jgi:hypothetical protein
LHLAGEELKQEEDLIKVTVKFIRRGTVGRKKRNISCSPCRNGSKNSKWLSPTPGFILESWGKYTWSKIMGLGG